ncbi:hypothetical protein GCM10009735_38040 [Actinomadura chokoriensis]
MPRSAVLIRSLFEQHGRLVPCATTVCSASAVKMSWTSRSAIRVAFGSGSVSSRRRPAGRLWAGERHRLHWSLPSAYLPALSCGFRSSPNGVDK